MSSQTTLKAVLIGEDRSLSRTMKGASKDVNAVGDDIDRTSDKGGKFGGVMGKMGGAVTAGLAVAGAAVVGFAFQSIQSASDLSETMGKSKKIWGDAAGEIEEWGSTAYKTLGLSKNEAIGAAASFGDMFQQLGVGRTEAKDMSKDVVQLATDLGSFHNLETADVLERIGGAFRGEFDSLQALIPNISSARVENEALAMTGKKSAGELTAQEKAMATLSIITKDGAAAAGDFADTSGGLANQQKILKAAFEDTKAEVGDALMPIMVDLGRWLIDEGIPAVKKMTAWWQDHKAEIQQVASVVGKVLMVLGKAVVAVTKAQVSGWEAVGKALAWVWSSVVVPVVSAIIGALSGLMRTWAGMLRALSKVPGFGWAKAAADKMDGAADKADALKAAVQRIPGSKTIGFAALTGGAVSNISVLQRRIDSVTGKSVTVRVRYVTEGRLPSGGLSYAGGSTRAAGGPVWPNMPTLVGENGPELVTFGATGHVTPARQTAEVLSSRGRTSGSTMTDERPIVVQLMADGRMLQEVLVKRKRATGQNLGLA